MAQPIPKSKALTIAQSFNEPLPTLPQALVAPNVHRLTTESCMPSLERTFWISCEADVVRVAALYFLHPVNLALTARYPDVLIHCLSESGSAGARARPDIVFKKNGRTFAVLEYKVVGVVVKSEFTPARLPMTASPDEVEKKRARSAIKIVKQMTAYSEDSDFNTKYIALLNWDFLFLAVFNRDADAMHGGLVSRTGSEGNQLRKAFLGWLLEPYANDGQSKLDPPARRGSASGSGTGKDGGSGRGGGGSGGPGTPGKPTDSRRPPPGQTPIAYRTRQNIQPKDERKK
ncbi:hypothetical protein QBC33DRAFT_597178 [Phialemonium atrogriseum]|uniref:Uncharacterized protein n=1 Tax=Phialemonium atrogriseum TaxID=1093897 RepID=A0AAJ0BSM6_9PEZI|nr:uncharacterized protein QBC33DRAFT_597178 [Phialemonium atrogriseum]KAK1763763.1 hypothetical protein QBC33DRAFT_597178 [Phialemonium atrogriseum]